MVFWLSKLTPEKIITKLPNWKSSKDWLSRVQPRKKNASGGESGREGAIPTHLHSCVGFKRVPTSV